MDAKTQSSRRGFLAGFGGASAAIVGLGLGTVARSAVSSRAPVAPLAPADDVIEVEDTPIEDLMREHAMLERVLLVYEEGAHRLDTGLELSPDVLAKAGGIIRRYIEDHHERDEEKHVFPRLEQIGVELELVKTLRIQHDAGRRLTSEVIRLSTLSSVRDPSERRQLVDTMRRFVRMYRPHAAHENTVLFPAFRKAVSRKEYVALEQALEKSERAAFGADLYERVMAEIRGLEGALGIGELAAFTPSV